MITQQRSFDVVLVVASLLCQSYDIFAIYRHKCHITINWMVSRALEIKNLLDRHREESEVLLSKFQVGTLSIT